jgi:hypothetical protein
MSQSSGFLHAFIAAAALILLPVARAETLPEADTREVRAYTLTEIALEKYVEATRKLSAIPLDCAADGPDVGSLTEAAARIDAVPGAKAAVRSTGLTSREYVLFAFSLIENAFASYALEQPGGKLPPGVSMSNIEFLRKNSGVIERLANETEVAECVEVDGSSG